MLEKIKEILAKVTGTDAIMAELDAELGKLYVPKTTFNEKNEELKTVQGELATAKATIAASGEAATKLQELQTKYNTDIAAKDADIKSIRQGYALDQKLAQSGVTQDWQVKAVKANLDLKAITYGDDGEVKDGLDAQITALKKSAPNLFSGTVQRRSPDPNVGGTVLPDGDDGDDNLGRKIGKSRISENEAANKSLNALWGN